MDTQTMTSPYLNQPARSFSTFIAERAEWALGEYCALFDIDFDQAYAWIAQDNAIALDIITQVYGIASPLREDAVSYLIAASREYV
jgi:hypothetical protein